MKQKINYRECIHEFCRRVGKSNYCDNLYWSLTQKYKLDETRIRDSEMYLSYYMDKVIPHKVAVYEAGMAITDTIHPGVNQYLWDLQLLHHDLSKFSVEEKAYAPYFTTTPESNSHKNTIEKNFNRAWWHHKRVNEHHPEYWWDIDKDGKAKPLEMPHNYIVEMIADWTGAGKTYGNPIEQWLPVNLPEFRFHPKTGHKLGKMLSKLLRKQVRYREDEQTIQLFIGTLVPLFLAEGNKPIKLLK